MPCPSPPINGTLADLLPQNGDVLTQLRNLESLQEAQRPHIVAVVKGASGLLQPGGLVAAFLMCLQLLFENRGCRRSLLIVRITLEEPFPHGQGIAQLALGAVLLGFLLDLLPFIAPANTDLHAGHMLAQLLLFRFRCSAHRLPVMLEGRRPVTLRFQVPGALQNLVSHQQFKPRSLDPRHQQVGHITGWVELEYPLEELLGRRVLAPGHQRLGLFEPLGQRPALLELQCLPERLQQVGVALQHLLGHRAGEGSDPAQHGSDLTANGFGDEGAGAQQTAGENTGFFLQCADLHRDAGLIRSWSPLLVLSFLVLRGVA